MEDRSIFVDLLPDSEYPLRVERTHRTISKPKIITYHLKGNRSKQFRSMTHNAIRMREHRKKPGVRERERKADNIRKQETRKNEKEKMEVY